MRLPKIMLADLTEQKYVETYPVQSGEAAGKTCRCRLDLVHRRQWCLMSRICVECLYF